MRIFNNKLKSKDEVAGLVSEIKSFGFKNFDLKVSELSGVLDRLRNGYNPIVVQQMVELDRLEYDASYFDKRKFVGNDTEIDAQVTLLCHSIKDNDTACLNYLVAHDYDFYQMSAISEGLFCNYNVETFLDPKYDGHQMYFILTGMKTGVDIKSLVDAGVSNDALMPVYSELNEIHYSKEKQ
ncbi:MAG: hypothetical protein R3Y64_10375 [Peptostreptococcaceae bacterium]